MKTFEEDRQVWHSGFRGYRDNSPEAIDRRLQDKADRHAKVLERIFLRHGVSSFYIYESGKLSAGGKLQKNK